MPSPCPGGLCDPGRGCHPVTLTGNQAATAPLNTDPTWLWGSRVLRLSSEEKLHFPRKYVFLLLHKGLNHNSVWTCRTGMGTKPGIFCTTPARRAVGYRLCTPAHFHCQTVAQTLSSWWPRLSPPGALDSLLLAAWTLSSWWPGLSPPGGPDPLLLALMEARKSGVPGLCSLMRQPLWHPGPVSCSRMTLQICSMLQPVTPWPRWDGVGRMT